MCAIADSAAALVSSSIANPGFPESSSSGRMISSGRMTSSAVKETSSSAVKKTSSSVVKATSSATEGASGCRYILSACRTAFGLQHVPIKKGTPRIKGFRL